MLVKIICTTLQWFIKNRSENLFTHTHTHTHTLLQSQTWTWFMPAWRRLIVDGEVTDKASLDAELLSHEGHSWMSAAAKWRQPEPCTQGSFSRPVIHLLIAVNTPIMSLLHWGLRSSASASEWLSLPQLCRSLNFTLGLVPYNCCFRMGCLALTAGFRMGCLALWWHSQLITHTHSLLGYEACSIEVLF